MTSRGNALAAAALAAPLLVIQPIGSEVAAAGVTHHHIKRAKAKKAWRFHLKAKRKKARRHYAPTKDSCVMLAPEDRDLIIRTVMGEAGGEPMLGKVAVAAVIKNRLLDGRYGGDTVKGVLFAPKQFEPWSTRRGELMRYSRSDPRYHEAAEAVDRAFQGDDPTEGATHFANVGTVADRGNNTALGWLRSMSNVSKIGAHTFGNADGRGDGKAVRQYDVRNEGGSVLGRMAGLDDDEDALRRLGDEPFNIEEAFASLNEPTDDPRRLAVRGLISEILDGLQPSAGQGHAVAPDSGAADEDEEA